MSSRRQSGSGVAGTHVCASQLRVPLGVVALAALLYGLAAYGQNAQAAPPNRPVIVRRGPATAPAPQQHPPVVRNQIHQPLQPGQPLRPGHLGEWMQQHQNLSPQDQQRALEREPGFNQLPPDQQARMRARLMDLNQMSPQQRQQVLNRVESMERLTPEQRQQVTATMGRLRALPLDQRQQVTRAFAQLRRLPPEQRTAATQQMDRSLNAQQRDALHSLVAVEPYLPIQRPAEAPGQPVVQ